MLKLLFKTRLCCRASFTTACRLNKKQQRDVTPVASPESSYLSTKVIAEFPPSVHTRPFEELHIENDESKEKHYDIGQFVDYLEPPLPIAFNLAAFVNNSESLQNLVHLGVDFSEIEKRPEAAKFILKLDFEKDMKSHIQFLHDHGINADDLGKLITKNPFVFQENLKNIEIRINYLKSKKFDVDAISRIITKNPYFLSTETKHIDSRLGFFQKQFSLSGDEVRYLATRCPKLISYNFNKIREKLFVFKEEMGYTSTEMKTLLLAKPKIWMLASKSLRERFDIVHNLMKLSHERILEFPGVFLTRGFILKQRHLYLVHLSRSQYDPTKPLYVSLSDISTLTDSAFCEKCAKTSIEQFNEFLRTI